MSRFFSQIFPMLLVFAISLPVLSFADTLSIIPKEIVTVVETVYVEDKIPCAYKQEKVLDFANFLYSDALWERAAIEYLRYQQLAPDDSCAMYALAKAGVCFEKKNDYNSALKIYQMLLQKYPSSYKLAKYRISLNYFLKNELDSAEIFLRNIDDDALLYLKGWLEMKKGNWASAETIFRSLEGRELGVNLSGSIDFLVSRCRMGAKIGDKNPFFAGILSAIIPGLGRVYCGRWGDGIFSFFLIGITAASSAYLWEKDKAFSYTMASISTFFWLGNVYGSVKGTQIENKIRRQKFWNETINQVPHCPSSLYSEMSCTKE